MQYCKSRGTKKSLLSLEIKSNALSCSQYLLLSAKSWKPEELCGQLKAGGLGEEWSDEEHSYTHFSSHNQGNTGQGRALCYGNYVGIKVKKKKKNPGHTLSEQQMSQFYLCHRG